MPIRVLDPAVAAKIAAGEVVERPASVVKELVENALDAEARSVTIEIAQGGSGLIRVTDDGCGIPANEVELAFQRHATSKVHTIDDLQSLRMLGFRGEALPSIAAVARVSLLTRTADADAGAFVQVADGRMGTRRAQAASPGTVVTVERLFQTLPARRKYLKSPAAESARIHALVAALALSHPDVRFRLTSDGRPMLHSPGTGSLRDALAVVLGADTASQMLEVTPDEGPRASVCSVEGYISPPSLSRASRSGIILFVNRRCVQNRLLAYALEEAYQGFLMERRHPLAVLNISISPDQVDVNVHPAKSEVRFLKEREVLDALQHAVRNILVSVAPVPQVRWWSREDHVQAAAPARFWTPSIPLAQSSFNEATATTGVSGQQEEPGSLAAPETRRRLPVLRVLGQVGTTYIVAEGPDGVFLIDQHAAHERVLFEQVISQLRTRTPEMQGLLEPVTVELAPGQAQAVLAHDQMLKDYGFQVEPFGEGVCLLRAVPQAAHKAGPAALFREVIDVMAEPGRSPEERTLAVAASIACHGAVRAGLGLGHQEMVALIRDLESAENPRTCPHGRPTIIHLSAIDLEREFGRR